MHHASSARPSADPSARQSIIEPHNYYSAHFFTCKDGCSSGPSTSLLWIKTCDGRVCRRGTEGEPGSVTKERRCQSFANDGWNSTLGSFPVESARDFYRLCGT